MATQSIPHVVSLPAPQTIRQITQLELLALLSLRNRARQLAEQARSLPVNVGDGAVRRTGGLGRNGGNPVAALRAAR
jgi:hypothetical protein